MASATSMEIVGSHDSAPSVLAASQAKGQISQKPVCVLIMGLDGVFIGDRAIPQFHDQITKKAAELFPKKQGLVAYYTSLEWRIAASHFFDEPAIANFEMLIKKVSEVYEVRIAISSYWREDIRTAKDFREKIFQKRSFAPLIMDVITDGRSSIEENLPVIADSKQKYGFDLGNRGKEIAYWINENKERLKIDHFVIFDDGDNGISERFPHNFVKVKSRFSKEDAEKAYQVLYPVEMRASADKAAKVFEAETAAKTTKPETVDEKKKVEFREVSHHHVRFAELTEEYFAATYHEPPSEELKALYKQLFPGAQKEKIDAILAEYKESATKHLKAELVDARQVQTLPLFAPGSLNMNALLRWLYEFGCVMAFSNYFHHLHSHFESEKARQAYAEAWVQKIYGDFKSGVPYAFSMMAQMLSERQFSYTSFAHLHPFNDVKQSIVLLKKMAAMGVDKAQSAMAYAYDVNHFGDDKNKVQLKFGVAERVEGLKLLAEQGYPFAQWQLASVYSYNRIGNDKCNFSVQERIEGFKHLVAIEREHNFYVTNSIWENDFGDLSLNYSGQERISLLEKRAQCGDRHSFSYLLRMYASDQLGERKFKVVLGLKLDERLKKIEELKKINKEEVNEFMAHCMRDNELHHGISLNKSLDERLKWLENAAFTENNRRARDILANAYEKKYLRWDEDLEMDDQQRLDKLCRLAVLGCREAMGAVFAYYEINGAKGSAEKQARTQMMIKIVIDGGGYDFGQRWFVSGNPQNKNLELLFSTLEFLRDFR